jgi:recombinational DNA repair protein RecR
VQSPSATREDAEHLVQAILDVKDKLGLCRICNNIADSELCPRSTWRACSSRSASK